MRAPLIPIPVTILESWLDVVTVWATVGAALVTAVTAVLIFLQIRQTKLSVKATERTLELAMAEQELSRQLMVDAQKSRIDAELPKLLVWVDYQSKWAFDPRFPQTFVFTSESASTERDLPKDHRWSLPHDGALPIAVSLGVRISNDGPRRARLSLGIRGDPDRGSYVKEMVIGAGEVDTVRLERSHTVAEWAAISSHDYSPLGDVGEHGWNWDVLTVTYIHQGTEGAIERWVVRQGGSPLVAVPGEPGQWMLGSVEWTPGNEGGLNAGIDIPTREYYSSMSEQRRLV